MKGAPRCVLLHMTLCLCVCVCVHLLTDLNHDYRVADGTAYVWGYNEFGQLGLGDHVSRTTPHVLTSPNSENITAIAFGYYHCAFIAGVMRDRAEGWWWWS